MQQFSRVMTWTLLIVGTLLLVVTTLEAAPSPSMHPGFYSDLAEDEPQYEILQMLARLGQNMIRDDLENENRERRRTADFGFSRGYSGTLEAVHRLGHISAADPRGPGKKRSSFNPGYLAALALSQRLLSQQLAADPNGPGKRSIINDDVQ